jgi:hypothetical protein
MELSEKAAGCHKCHYEQNFKGNIPDCNRLRIFKPFMRDITTIMFTHRGGCTSNASRRGERTGVRCDPPEDLED